MIEELIDLEINEFPKKVLERSKWILMDTMFVTWYGNQSNELQSYIKAVEQVGDSQEDLFPIIGEKGKTTLYHQMVIHGTSIVGNEMDEGNQFAKGHPAAHVFPPALAAALENKATGEEFLRAFIIGYEASARFAEIAAMDDDMHPHGTWGMIGGTIAAGILQKKSKEEIIESVYISASLPIATSWQSAVTGETIRDLYTGLSCWQSYNALQLQSYGFRSSMHIVKHLWGSVLSKSKNFDETKFNVDAPYMIERNYFKLFPACRFSHSPIDALNNILEEVKINVVDIEKVIVETYGLAARLDDPNPDTLLASKFSIPFLLSTILNGHSLFETSKDSVFHNESIREFTNKITVHESDEMNALLPEKRAAKVTIKLNNGEEKTSFVDSASGEYDRPFSKDAMIDKMQKIAKNFLSEQDILKVVDSTLQIEQQKDLFDWVNIIANLRKNA